jgi:SAM-dependent methyltransferase
MYAFARVNVRSDVYGRGGPCGQGVPVATARERLMGDEVRFAKDLYKGAAGHYDRYRLPYPEAMTAHLIQRAGVTGDGRLLDLACGTGQLAFPLRQWFSEVWAVDREPDMVHMVRYRQRLPPVDRDLVAARLLRWLRPGGCVALCWSNGPFQGGEPWQRALAATTLDRWRAALGVEDSVPANWDEPRRLRPDHQVLADAGFTVVGHEEFAVEHRWRLPELTGFIRSTSALPAAVLGDQEAAFDADLAVTLGPFAGDGSFTESVSFAYELGPQARRYGSGTSVR